MGKKGQIIAVLFAIYCLALVGVTYNGMVTKDQSATSQWAQVEMQYTRRFDLIPNLVNSTKGYMAHETKVFENLAKARSEYAGARSLQGKIEATNHMEGALGRLLAIAESYPELKSNETVQKLMDELSGTENRISVERMRYNDAVRLYNTTIKRFPSSLVAKAFGFDAKDYLSATTPASLAPRVSLD